MNANFPNLAASGLALAVSLATTGANAQTVISRSISAEAVETTVTQTPNGTIVTRRPVEGQVIQHPIVQPPIVQTGPAVVETAPNSIDAITTREVVRTGAAREALPRTMTTRHVSARQDRHATRTKTVRKTTHTTTRTITRPQPRLALDPRERHIVYQTIIEREVMPRQVIVAPPSVAPAPYPQPQIVQPYGGPARPPIVAADEDVVAAPVPVGSVLPANVPLYAIPQNVALSVPAAQSYSYAYLGGRAYLVDPASGTVVADVTE